MFSTFIKCQIIIAFICNGFSYEHTEENLKCFNDYDTEMKCSLSTDRLKSCSGYKLNITHNVFNMNQNKPCIFEKSHPSDKCECKIKVQGFVITEIYTATLLEGTDVLYSKKLKTEDFIKPKTPVLSVQKTENGNFNVTWDDQYSDSVTRNFLETLTINLSYGIKGGLEKISKTVQNTVGSFEIVGKNLQQNTDYVLTATMSTSYNGHSISSDQSAPVEFTAPSSPNEIAKLVIPTLCFGLIVIIFVIFFCILRMKMNWWDKISKPKIDANLGEEKGHILPLSVMKFSAIHVEIPTLDPHENKKLISALSVDTNNEKSSHSVESAQVDYGQACTSSPEENICTIDVASHVKRALDDLFSLHPTPNKPSSLSPYNQVTMSRSNKSVNGISFSREPNRANRDSGNCSGSSVFSNMSYLETATDDSLFLDQLSPDRSCQSNKRDVSDLDARDSQFNFPTNDTMEDGYRCFSSVLEQGNDADICLSDDVDEKCIMKNLIASTNPLYPTLILDDDSVTPTDEGYQAFQGLTKSTEGQLSSSVSTEQALNACGALKFPQSTGKDPTSFQQSSLHFSPSIQIDNLYQCV
ncbi:uncharacterized protein LOC127952417 isoform X2 [Carassius gibelio]|uniref:uncharacterized protein LOC127952417 isoform X2 n=1 Tax=Carassius gibelio TaxID=101364 RepID=UPI0022788F24|nr:uncharacterized protein LOC127952417 isoform X2 [Carassius gibelio]